MTECLENLNEDRDEHRLYIHMSTDRPESPVYHTVHFFSDKKKMSRENRPLSRISNIPETQQCNRTTWASSEISQALLSQINVWHSNATEEFGASYNKSDLSIFLHFLYFPVNC